MTETFKCNPNCPVTDLKEDVQEIKRVQQEMLHIIGDNKMILTEIKNLHENFRKFEERNEKAHDIFFAKLNSKLDKSDAKWSIGIVLSAAIIVFTIINLILNNMR